MRILVATHGNCLDGLASAALFTHLIRHLEPSASEIDYRTCIYGPKPVPFGPDLLDGQINAILDYRFYRGPELNWYFDHHATAFSTPEDEAGFNSRRGSGQFYFDSKSASCAGLIGRVTKERFGLSLGHLDALVDLQTPLTPRATDRPARHSIAQARSQSSWPLSNTMATTNSSRP